MSSKGWTWAGINSCAVKLSSKILLQEFGEVWEGTGIYCWYIVQYFFSLWKCSKSCLWEQINLFLVDKFTIDRWISSRNNGASSSPPHMFLSEKIWDPKENAGVLQYYTIYQYDILCVFLCWVHWDLRFKIPIYIWTCFFFLRILPEEVGREWRVTQSLCLLSSSMYSCWMTLWPSGTPIRHSKTPPEWKMLLSRITDVICNCPIDWSMISMCGHQVTDWIQLTVAWSRIPRWFCCLLILMFSWTMVFHMVFKLSTIMESDQKHFLHSRMWVFVAWCMSCGLWHSSPAHIFYWNGVPRPRYGSAQCSMAVKLLNDLGRLNSLWRRN